MSARIAAILALAAVAAGAQIILPNPYQMTPRSAKAQTESNLSVISERYTCAEIFSNHTVKFTPRDGRGGSIHLTAVVQHTARPCPVDDRDYGPNFRLPALPTGNHFVTIQIFPSCVLLPRPCDVPLMQEPVGALMVTEKDGEADWVLSPRRVAANRPFKLYLLSGIYQDCNWAFPVDTATSGGGRIVVSFDIKHYPERLCLVENRPAGPVWGPMGLPPGRYPVYHVPVPREPLIFVDTLIIDPPTRVDIRLGKTHSGHRLRIFQGGAPGPDAAGAEAFSLLGQKLRSWDKRPVIFVQPK